MNFYSILNIEQNISHEELLDKYNTCNDKDKYEYIYDILLSFDKRIQYDNELYNINNIRNINFENIFSKLWDNKKIYKKEKLKTPIDITILELYIGCNKIITIDNHCLCKYCLSKGCELCSNLGYNKINQTVRMNIEKGTQHNEYLYIYGNGINICNIVSINQINDTDFIRKGSNLFYTYNISLSESFYKNTFEIEFIDKSKISYNLDCYIRPDTETILKNKGMPIREKPGFYGDLVINYNILYPINIDKQLRIDISKLIPMSNNTIVNKKEHEKNINDSDLYVDNSNIDNNNCPIQ